MTRTGWMGSALLLALAAVGLGCGADSTSNPDADVGDAVETTEGTDVGADADADVPPEGLDVPTDTPTDTPADTPTDTPADTPTDTPADVPPTVCGPIPGGDCDDGFTCDIHGCGDGATGYCVPTPGDCLAVWMPVCGCDGETYGNDCERLRAGVALDHDGACATTATCGGGAEPRCDGDAVCDIRACGDGVSGICVLLPEVCPEDWAPVCGCDGRTYANDCNRLRAGAALDHEGLCDTGTACGGAGGTRCDFGQVCNVLTCADDATGTCVTLPRECPDAYEPVCGCNGITFDNDCLRLRARVALDHEGECPATVCGGVGGLPCPDGQVCNVTGCFPDAAGVCVVDPAGRCPPRIEYVCGCDGVTYDNDCLRIDAGVALDHEGSCDVTDCTPVCQRIGGGPGARTGWVNPCTGRTICEAACTGCTASCEAVGTRSEGWYASCADPGTTGGCPGSGLPNLIRYDSECG